MSKLEISLNNSLEELNRIQKEVSDFCGSAKIDEESQYNIQLVLEEILTNIINYAYPEPGNHKIEIVINLKNELMTIIIVDDGSAFDPTAVEEPALDEDINNRQIGGLGLFLVKNLMQDISYERRNDRNHLKINTKVKLL